MKYLILVFLPLALTGCDPALLPTLVPPPQTSSEVQDRPDCFHLSPADPSSCYWAVGGREWGLGEEGIIDQARRAWILGQVFPVPKGAVIDNLGEPKHFTQSSLSYRYQGLWVTVFCESTPSPEASCYSVKEGE